MNGCHCLAKEICDHDGMDMWIDRILKILDFFIEGVIEAAVSVGIPSNRKGEIVDFMIQRRREIGHVCGANIAMFPKPQKVSVQ